VLLCAAGAAATDPKVERLKAWFLSFAGAFVSPDIEVRYIPGRGRGVFATREIPAGTAVIGAPTSLSLTPAAVLKRFPEWKSLQLEGISLLALFLAVEKYHLPEKSWANALLGRERQMYEPFTSMLEEECENGATMTDRQLRVLRKICGVAYATNVTLEYRNNLVRSGFTKHAFPVSEEQYRWGMCTAMSRSWEGHVMMPFVIW
jgi:hypothetical protein